MSRNERDPMLPFGTDKCRCPLCGQYFNSTYAFERHRRIYKETRALRCLSGDELKALGWDTNRTGHWITGRRSLIQGRAA